MGLYQLARQKLDCDACLFFCVSLLVLLCYSPCLTGGFMWDESAIVKNPLLRSWDGLVAIWLQPALNRHEAHYWPFTYTVLWGQYQLWALFAPGYHLVNFLLHALNSVLLRRVLLRLRVPGALLAALVFALHPAHVESVAWIIQLKDLLSTLFFLLSLLAYLRWSEEPRLSIFAWALVAYLAALLSKSMAITLPGVLLLIEWLRRGQLRKAHWIAAAPFAAVGLIYGLADTLFFQRREILPVSRGLFETTGLAARAIWFYIGRLIWPAPAPPIFPNWSSDRLDIGAVVALTVAAVSLFSLCHKIGRGWLVALAIYVVVLSPVLGFIPFGFQSISWVADRFQYLASAAPIAAVAAGLSLAFGRLRHPDKARLILYAALIGTLGFLTYQQARLWSDDLRFWTAAYQSNPASPEVADNYARTLSDRKRFADAMEVYRRSLNNAPGYARAYLNLGVLYAELDQPEKAEPLYQKAISLRPDLPEPYYNLALIQQQRGDQAAATANLKRALSRNPIYANARAALGNAYAQTGDSAAAIREYEEALRLEPNSPGMRKNLKMLLSER